MEEEGLPCGEFGIESKDQALDRDLKRVGIDFLAATGKLILHLDTQGRRLFPFSDTSHFNHFHC